MAAYLVNTNKQPNGDHEVHKSDCGHLPLPQHRHQLGDFSSCAPAVAEAKKVYPMANGCYYCALACHTG